MPQLYILTNVDITGRLCHQVSSRRFRTRWDERYPPVCPSCGCLSRPLSTEWWATELMAMKDKIPATTPKVRGHSSWPLLLLFSFLSPSKLLIFLFKEKLLEDLLYHLSPSSLHFHPFCLWRRKFTRSKIRTVNSPIHPSWHRMKLMRSRLHFRSHEVVVTSVSKWTQKTPWHLLDNSLVFKLLRR